MQLPAWEEIEAALAPLGLALSPAELHGALSGWLAGGGDPGEDWLARVLADDAAPRPDAQALRQLRDATARSMEDRDLDFRLMLPGDEATLEVRGNALFDWCRAFVGGFGLAAGGSARLSEEGEEALEDLARLAAAEAQSDGDEEDEAAFAELEEFVRIAALLLHGDCAMAQRHRQRLH